MSHLVDLNRYPLDQPDSAAWTALVASAKADLARDGLFNLPGFLKPKLLAPLVAQLEPRLETESFRHARRHNIYFRKNLPELEADHPALIEMDTVNHTLCTDQLGDTGLLDLYEWPMMAGFLAAVMDKPALYTMADTLSGLNVMGYHEGEALNWHFDRSEFTITLLLQAADQGGAFEYARDLRSEDDPNFDGVADLLSGRRPPTVLPIEPGTLNVFLGKNTAHRVSTVGGPRPRVICVFCYYERPGVAFTAEEQIGFYGRTG